MDTTGALEARLVIGEEDLAPAVRTAFAAGAVNARMLGPTEAGSKTFWDGVAGAVIRRASRIVPPGFKVSEIELTLEVEGQLFGSSITGNVGIRLAPVPEKVIGS